LRMRGIPSVTTDVIQSMALLTGVANVEAAFKLLLIYAEQ